MVYDDCLLCLNPLNNVDGPGKSNLCTQFCDDVVEICANHHKVHRGCILSACNADNVDVAGQMGMSEYSFFKPQQPLITECDNFKSRELVARVPVYQLFERPQAGGKHKKKRITRNQRKKGNKRTKRTNKY